MRLHTTGKPTRLPCMDRVAPAKAIFSILVAASCTMARAGAPFLTDDPEPVDRHHAEVNLAAQGTRSASGESGALTADINYGCARDTQCHLAIPLAFARAAGSTWQSGIGDVELGFKYRFVHREEDGVMAAIYPTAFLPTGSASRGLGNGSVQILLPVWLQKPFGNCIWDAGAGYLVNRAAGARNSWFFGLLARRQVGDRWTVGAEIFHRTALAQDVPAATGFNIGATLKLSDSRNVLFSAGRGLAGVAANRFSFYAAYQLEL